MFGLGFILFDFKNNMSQQTKGINCVAKNIFYHIIKRLAEMLTFYYLCAESVIAYYFNDRS